jgi:DNA-binding NarL/FixJ family response regulator
MRVEFQRGRLCAYDGEHQHESEGGSAMLLPQLTAREREIITHIVGGETCKDIGRELGISHRTVHAHKTHAMKKLHLKSRRELVRVALETGLLRPVRA